jgi:hypothetical protein
MRKDSDRNVAKGAMRASNERKSNERKEKGG